MFRIRKKYIIGVFAIAFFVVLLSFFVSVPDLAVDKITKIPQTLTIYDKEGQVCATLNAGENRQTISINDIPQHVIDALISTEDIRFYEHNGIDIKRIFGALANDILSGSLKEGASTITQQLIKNSHLTSEKSFLRKINEAILALQLEKKFEKNEILEMYFNYVYFGRGAYGIQAASQAYFGINVQELDVQQGATLIGILKAPSKYAPHIDMEKSLLRRNTVLSQMKKYGYISEEQFKDFSLQEIKIIEKVLLPDYGYYTDYILEESAEKLNVSVSDILAGGYKIYTCQDSYLQDSLQKIYSNEENFPKGQNNAIIQSAAVIVDNYTGALCAMVGGRSHEGMRVYNRADAKRQPGSCIKPILVYAPAFENKSITPLTVLDDCRKNFFGYSPTNYKNIYYGNVTVRKALSSSLNIPAVELLLKNGIDYSKNYAKMTGIDFHAEDNHLAIALGGMKYGVSPITLAGSYSTFARYGTYIEPWCIDKITDNEGNVLYKHKNEKKKVFSESTSFLITDILTDVSRNENNKLSVLNKKIACKTGTVGYNENGNSDAWSVAYVNSHTVCVWMGYDKTDNEHFLSENVTGSSYPSTVCSEVFRKLFEKYEYEEFKKPNSVKRMAIDGFSLKNENKIYVANEIVPSDEVVYEYFDTKNMPQEISSYWSVPELPKNINVNLNELRQAEISFTVSKPYIEYIIYKKDFYGEKEIARISSEKNKRVYVTDEEYSTGDCYLIQPAHKSILIDGKQFCGKKSREYSIH